MSNQVILAWGSGVCFGSAVILLATPMPGLFLFPLLLSVVFMFLSIRKKPKC